ncbi:MAG: biopolymer transport protein ExbD [Planctomycetota bacterium]|jgi:biopolymer transport protein ExbD
MATSLKEIATENHDMEMTPMIDVTFLLLIFFICTLKFKTLEGKLAAYLPKDVGVNTSDDEPIEKVEITLKVLKEGTKLKPKEKDTDPDIIWDGTPGTRYIYGSDRRVSYSIGPRAMTDIADVQALLEQLHKADDSRPATIDARKGTVTADVIFVLDAAMNANFDTVTFVGAYD